MSFFIPSCRVTPDGDRIPLPTAKVFIIKDRENINLTNSLWELLTRANAVSASIFKKYQESLVSNKNIQESLSLNSDVHDDFEKREVQLESIISGLRETYENNERFIRLWNDLEAFKDRIKMVQFSYDKTVDSKQNTAILMDELLQLETRATLLIYY